MEITILGKLNGKRGTDSIRTALSAGTPAFKCRTLTAGTTERGTVSTCTAKNARTPDSIHRTLIAGTTERGTDNNSHSDKCQNPDFHWQSLDCRNPERGTDSTCTAKNAGAQNSIHRTMNAGTTIFAKKTFV